MRPAEVCLEEACGPGGAEGVYGCKEVLRGVLYKPEQRKLISLEIWKIIHSHFST